MKEELQEVPSKSPLKMAYWRGTSEKLVVVFSGVGNDPHEHAPFEFFRSATEDKRNHALFISDISRSWLNGEGVSNQIVDAINRVSTEAGTSETHLIGNSMGGSMALLIKDQVRAKTVLSFVPQYSVCPDIVPEEKRWMRFRKRIKFFKYPKITIGYAPKQSILIVHGGTPTELIHARRFPRVRWVRHFILPHMGHNLAEQLKRQGHLDLLISSALSGRNYRFRCLIERNGGLYIHKFEEAKWRDSRRPSKSD